MELLLRLMLLLLRLMLWLELLGCLVDHELVEVAETGRCLMLVRVLQLLLQLSSLGLLVLLVVLLGLHMCLLLALEGVLLLLELLGWLLPLLLLLLLLLWWCKGVRRVGRCFLLNFGTFLVIVLGRGCLCGFDGRMLLVILAHL